MPPTDHPPPLDADLTTLHIRCGSDIRDRLRDAGLTGDFLEYSDPVCQGPVPDTPDLMDRRAGFVAESFGWFKHRDAAGFLADLRDAEQRLAAAHSYQRVVFWCEHDSYDQLVLVRCLAHFADAPCPAHLELICIDRHPSVARFIGLGQLDAPALAALWPTRTPVTEPQIALGQAIWTALRRPDPTDLAAIAATGTPVLPIAAPALRRHLRELPGVIDGLSLTERLVLRILADQPSRIGRIFGAFQSGIEPLPFLGDIGVMGVVEQMATTQPPVLTIEPGTPLTFPRVATITETGRQVLAGTIGYLSLNPPERWVGGVRVDGRWRWDEANAAVVQSS
jgi:hypothetical protein